MAKASTAQHFCVQCGAAMTGEQRICSHCGTALDERRLQTTRQAGDGEATLRVVARPVSGLREDEQQSAPDDAEKTVRAVRVSSRLYAEAARQEARNEEASRGVGLPRPLQVGVERTGNHKGPHPIWERAGNHKGPHSTPSDRERAGNHKGPHSTPSDRERTGDHKGPHPTTASTPAPTIRRRVLKKPITMIGCGAGLFLLLSLLVLGAFNYSGNAQAARQISQNQVALERLLVQAQAIGVPAALLRPALQQEQQLADSSNLLARLSSSSAYHKNIQRYHALMARVAAIMTEATTQAQGQAQQDVQNFQTALTRATAEGTDNIEELSQQLSQCQLALAAAKTPRDYAAVSQDARAGVLSLGAMEIALSQLSDFNATIGRLKGAGIDVMALQAAYQSDLQQLKHAARARDFQNLGALLDAQYQQAVVSSVRAFPYVSVSRLNELQTQIMQLKSYGLDASAYQQRLVVDQEAMAQAKTVFDDLVFLKQVDADIASMQDELVQGEANYLVRQFDREVKTWAKAHPYYDSYNGQSYALDSGYTQAGIGASLDSDLAGATTTADYEAMVAEAQNALFNLHMLEADYSDHTPYNQVHQTDLEMLRHYRLQNRTVLMISLVEQALRVYQNGKLLRAFYVTTGRAELPSLPGVWGVLERKSPMIFVAGDPKGSPYWFPPTPIQYAIMYHYGGYFVHDAWWRASFGPGTEFPHHDAGGNTAYNFDGSHGCINLTTSDAAWVYQHTDWNTLIVIY